MHVVIVGCGRVGAGLAASLADEGHDVVLVDKDPGAFDKLGGTFNGITVTGAGIDHDILKRAEIEKADAFAAVTSSDNVNIMAAQVAREIFGVTKVVARINEPGREPIFHELGIATFCPTDLGVTAVKSMLLSGHVQTRHVVGAGEIVIAEVTVGGDKGGRTVRELELPGKVRICAVIVGGTARMAEPDLLCQAGDVLVVGARLDAFETFGDLMRGNRDGDRFHLPFRAHDRGKRRERPEE
ncbi:MAG: potassium channel family protein [Bacteroidota bacterium]